MVIYAVLFFASVYGPYNMAQGDRSFRQGFINGTIPLVPTGERIILSVRLDWYRYQCVTNIKGIQNTYSCSGNFTNCYKL